MKTVMVVCMLVLIAILNYCSADTQTFEVGNRDEAKVKLASSSDWISGYKGICGPGAQTTLTMEACQGEKSYSDKSLDVLDASVMFPGASFGRYQPANVLIKYPKFGSSGPKISYIRMEYQFPLSTGTANLISGGVGSSSALIQLSSPRALGYAYRVEFFTNEK